MKRFVSVIIVLALTITSLSGCFFEKLTAFGLYTRAINTIAKAGGFEADCVIEMSFDSDMLSFMSITMEGNIKKNGDNTKVAVSLGGESESVTTMIGKDVYVKSGDIKIRYTMPENDESEDSGKSANMLPDLAKEMFDGLEVTENEDGTKSVTVHLSADIVSEIFNNSENGTGAFSDMSELMTMSDTDMVMTFDENNDLSELFMDCAVTYNLFGEINGRISVDYTFVNFGTAPNVLPPDDAESYVLSEENNGL